MDNSEHENAPRLGIIISMFPELHETFILRELVALERRGVRFDIFSLQRPRDPITLDDAIRLSTERTTYSSLISPSTLAAFSRVLFSRPGALIRTVGRLIVEGRDRPTDIAKNLAILPLSLLIGEMGRERGITHWHGHWANIPTTACWFLSRIHHQSWSAAIHGEDIFSANRFLSYKLNDAQFAVVCSGYFCHHLKTQLNLERPENVHLNYHGLDPRVTSRTVNPVTAAKSETDTLSLVSIGRLVPTKGHDLLIRACGEVMRSGLKVTLRLVGSGPLENELKSLAEAEGLDDCIEFCGALSFEQVLTVLEQADVFVLAPRLIAGHPPDGIPNVIAEAMALGIPIVTTRVSAIPELVEDNQTGLLVDAEDVSGFAKAIERLFHDPKLASTLSQAGRERVSMLFNQDSNIADLLTLFERYVPTNFITGKSA